MLRFDDNIIMSYTTKSLTTVNEKTALSYRIPVFHLFQSISLYPIDVIYFYPSREVHSAPLLIYYCIQYLLIIIITRH